MRLAAMENWRSARCASPAAGPVVGGLKSLTWRAIGARKGEGSSGRSSAPLSRRLSPPTAPHPLPMGVSAPMPVTPRGACLRGAAVAIAHAVDSGFVRCGIVPPCCTPHRKFRCSSAGIFSDRATCESAPRFRRAARAGQRSPGDGGDERRGPITGRDQRRSARGSGQRGPSAQSCTMRTRFGAVARPRRSTRRPSRGDPVDVVVGTAGGARHRHLRHPPDGQGWARTPPAPPSRRPVPKPSFRWKRTSGRRQPLRPALHLRPKRSSAPGARITISSTVLIRLLEEKEVHPENRGQRKRVQSLVPSLL